MTSLDRASAVKIPALVGILFGATALVVAYGPLLLMFFRQQWQKPHYQHFPFVIAAFAWLLWDRIRESVPRNPVRDAMRWYDYALLLLSVVILAASIALRSPFGALVSCILLIGYCLRVVSGARIVRNLTGVWLILWLLAPLPMGYDQTLISKLQALSSRISSCVLDLLGVNHLMEGNTLHLVSRELFVDEACSGIISIVSIIACAVIYGVYRDRSLIHILLLGTLGVFWATMVNVARITTIALLLDRFGIDWSVGLSHELLSLGVFLVTFAALLSSDCMLEVGLAPIGAVWHEYHDRDLTFGQLLAAAWDMVVSPRRQESASVSCSSVLRPALSRVALRKLRTPLLVLVPLACVQAALFYRAWTVAPAQSLAVNRALEITDDALPEKFLGLSRDGFESQQRSEDNIHGMYSKAFTYVDEASSDAKCVVSLDFPFFSGWHELTTCYLASGWEGKERYVRSAPSGPSVNDWPYVEATFTKPGGSHSAVLYAEFDQYGQPIAPHDGWQRPPDSYFRVRNYYLEEGKTFQVQVFLVGDHPQSESDLERARNLLIEARERLRARLIESQKGRDGELLRGNDTEGGLLNNAREGRPEPSLQPVSDAAATRVDSFVIE